MRAIERRVPPGVGRKSTHDELRRVSFAEIVQKGARKLISMGYGWMEDAESIEEYGCLAGADLDKVSQTAISRSHQLATIGGGNHFVELQEIVEVYDQQLAKAWGLEQGNLAVMLHSGSRGFGHQICTDYSKIMAQAAAKYDIELPSRGLAAAPIHSKEGQDYLAAMACAVNFAFCNRQLMAHDVRLAFGEVFKEDPRALGLWLVYDVAHNIAKFEEHFGRKVLVHRKGATRALPPGHPYNPKRYMATGHPVIIPGSMGTSSYVLVGAEATQETFYSVNHGAGRVLSRTAAKKVISKDEFQRSMGDILYNAGDFREILEEAPQAYKNIDDVVESLAEIGLTKKVVRLRPLAVIKGQGEEA